MAFNLIQIEFNLIARFKFSLSPHPMILFIPTVILFIQLATFNDIFGQFELVIQDLGWTLKLTYIWTRLSSNLTLNKTCLVKYFEMTKRTFLMYHQNFELVFKYFLNQINFIQPKSIRRNNTPPNYILILRKESKKCNVN